MRSHVAYLRSLKPLTLSIIGKTKRRTNITISDSGIRKERRLAGRRACTGLASVILASSVRHIPQPSSTATAVDRDDDSGGVRDQIQYQQRSHYVPIYMCTQSLEAFFWLMTPSNRSVSAQHVPRGIIVASTNQTSTTRITIFTSG